MPFLIGLQASLLPSLKQLPMDEVSLIDLDLGTCQPPPGSPTDDARLLPWADRLQAALQVTTIAIQLLRHLVKQCHVILSKLGCGCCFHQCLVMQMPCDRTHGILLRNDGPFDLSTTAGNTLRIVEVT